MNFDYIGASQQITKMASINPTKEKATNAELESFLLKETTPTEMTADQPFKVCIISSTTSPKEDTLTKDGHVEEYNPFEYRSKKNQTTDVETFIHLLKASLGSGILSMPFAFKCAGLVTGILTTVFSAFMCTYTAYVLILSAHALYYRTKISSMTYGDVAEAAFSNGPKVLRKFSTFGRLFVSIGLFCTYFGAVSVYTVVAATSYKEVIEHYSGHTVDIRVYILSFLPVLIVLGYIPNLKILAPFSMVANVLMGAGLCITMYYVCHDIITPFQLRQIPSDLNTFPQAFTIAVFALEAIGLIMPLENNMENPRHFAKPAGVLNTGMTAVTVIYLIVGVLGYVAYGDNVQGSISSNLEISYIGAQIARLCIGAAVLLTYVLQYFVCLDITWNFLKGRITKHHNFYNYLLRTLLVTCSVLLAVAVPTISPFVGLIGAFCFSFLGILFPMLIYSITFWNIDSQLSIILKSILVGGFGLFILCFGTYASLLEVIQLYMPNGSPLSANAELTVKA